MDFLLCKVQEVLVRRRFVGRSSIFLFTLKYTISLINLV